MRLGLIISVCGAAVALLSSASSGLRFALAAPQKRAASVSPKTPHLKVPQTTRLRAAVPMVVFSKRRGQQLVEHLSVSVSNVGLAVATQVDIIAEFPDGISYALRGPKKIQPGQRSLYSLSGKKLVLRAGVPKILTTCGSCVR